MNIEIINAKLNEKAGKYVLIKYDTLLVLFLPQEHEIAPTSSNYLTLHSIKQRKMNSQFLSVITILAEMKFMLSSMLQEFSLALAFL